MGRKRKPRDLDFDDDLFLDDIDEHEDEEYEDLLNARDRRLARLESREKYTSWERFSRENEERWTGPMVDEWQDLGSYYEHRSYE